VLRTGRSNGLPRRVGGHRSTPEPIATAGQAELIEDNGASEWYKNLQTSRTAPGRLAEGSWAAVHDQIPLSGSHRDAQCRGGEPNSARFTLRWKGPRPPCGRYRMQHGTHQKRLSMTFARRAQPSANTASLRAAPRRRGPGISYLESNKKRESGPCRAFSGKSSSIAPPITPRRRRLRACGYTVVSSFYNDIVIFFFSAPMYPSRPTSFSLHLYCSNLHPFS